jgi:hypothetical protein
VVAQTGASSRDAAISELDIEGAKRRGRADDEETMEEANRRVPSPISGLMTYAQSFLPKRGKSPEESHKGEQRDGHGEEDDVARERHVERSALPG